MRMALLGISRGVRASRYKARFGNPAETVGSQLNGSWISSYLIQFIRIRPPQEYKKEIE
jgi:hypothetical protein